MDEKIIETLTQLSEEEKEILSGKNIRKGDYSFTDKFIVNSKKLLSNDKSIDLRLHTRFIDFPEHGHDYMEFMYVYSGKITHVIKGQEVVLQSGDILFLNKHIRHSIKLAQREDIGINFIVSNSFLQYIFHNVEHNPIISEFLMRNFSPNGEEEYLHFQTKDVYPIRNLMDNLIYAIVRSEEQNYTILSQIVALLFSYLAQYKQTIANTLLFSSPNSKLRNTVCSYIEQQYPMASLNELAKQTGYNPAYLSRKIQQLFHKNFQTLLQEERLKVAEKLLRTSKLNIDEIIRTIGYENKTHFHALFLRTYGCTPYTYRKNHLTI